MLSKAGRFLLFLLPIFGHLFVSHGTIQRDYLGESVFGGIVFLTVAIGIVTSRKGMELRMTMVERVFVALLIFYMVIFNPLISIFYGNDPLKVATIATGVSMLSIILVFRIYRLPGDAIKPFLASFILLGVIVSLQVIYNYLSGGSADIGRSTGIVSGTSSKTLTLPFLPMTAVAALAFIIAAPNRKLHAASVIICMITITAMALTVTRGMYFATAAGFLCALFLFGLVMRIPVVGSLQKLAFFAFVFIALATMFSDAADSMLQAILDRPIDQGGTIDNTVLGRLDEYQAAWIGFTESPITGQGVGYIFFFPSEHDLVLSFLGTATPHNHFFFFLGAYGSIGVVLYYGFVFLVGKRIALSLLDYKSHLSKDNAVWLAAGASAFFAGFVFTLTSTTYLALGYHLFLGGIAYFAFLLGSSATRP
jgi:hypothetical protein